MSTIATNKITLDSCPGIWQMVLIVQKNVCSTRLGEGVDSLCIMVLAMELGKQLVMGGESS